MAIERSIPTGDEFTGSDNPFGFYFPSPDRYYVKGMLHDIEQRGDYTDEDMFKAIASFVNNSWYESMTTNPHDIMDSNDYDDEFYHVVNLPKFSLDNLYGFADFDRELSYERTVEDDLMYRIETVSFDIEQIDKPDKVKVVRYELCRDSDGYIMSTQVHYASDIEEGTERDWEMPKDQKAELIRKLGEHLKYKPPFAPLN